MKLIEGSRIPRSPSRVSFINSEFKEVNGSPEDSDTAIISNTMVNSYGRPTAAILP